MEPDDCEKENVKPKPKPKGKAKAKAKAKAKSSAPGKVRIEVEGPVGDCAYVPGQFRKRKFAYCHECTKEGFLNHWEALKAWEFSEERASLLRNLSTSELSRRRFD